MADILSKGRWVKGTPELFKFVTTHMNEYTTCSNHACWPSETTCCNVAAYETTCWNHAYTQSTHVNQLKQHSAFTHTEHLKQRIATTYANRLRYFEPCTQTVWINVCMVCMVRFHVHKPFETTFCKRTPNYLRQHVIQSHTMPAPRQTTEKEISFWWQFRHWLLRKLSNDNIQCSLRRKFRQIAIALKCIPIYLNIYIIYIYINIYIGILLALSSVLMLFHTGQFYSLKVISLALKIPYLCLVPVVEQTPEPIFHFKYLNHFWRTFLSRNVNALWQK